VKQAVPYEVFRTSHSGKRLLIVCRGICRLGAGNVLLFSQFFDAAATAMKPVTPASRPSAPKRNTLVPIARS